MVSNTAQLFGFVLNVWMVCCLTNPLINRKLRNPKTKRCTNLSGLSQLQKSRCGRVCPGIPQMMRMKIAHNRAGSNDLKILSARITCIELRTVYEFTITRIFSSIHPFSVSPIRSLDLKRVCFEMGSGKLLCVHAG